MLHIVNGDVVAEKLKAGGVPGDVLPWREIYSEGPVFLRPELPEHRAARGRYLEQALGIPVREWQLGSEAQERRLADFRRHGDVVLWFEHDLFDQAMLAYLLHWFAGQDLRGTRLHLLGIGEYPGMALFRGLGELSAGQLAGLAGTWSEIGERQLQLGRKAWEAYASRTPQPLAALLPKDTSALAFLHDAFLLHLRRFPSVHNGLGIVEQTTLELLQAGVDRTLELFRRTGDRLNGLGLGDIQYWRVLRLLAEAEHPMLIVEGDGRFPGLHDAPGDFLTRRVRLTPLGAKLASGEADWIALNGIDRWYGGVHLQGRSPIWRWDEAQGVIARA
ncbi:DUF1835 domain-containing protein [Paenibacillus arenilitoris]|uniref:DUF1835 domain-containing protein n=1 Tax=Paenibacillus arenilitoris TaxID=2772299 RepID=A0A927CQ70_9BACL|nr:DUF1835 domain-containing protein [Paenibacillus arenilitoris]MBD2870246.1 DUF1835 domain-containing protein [Paenibacillus arenilitoris]